MVAEVGGVERRGAVGQPLERPQPCRQRLERLLRRAAPLARQREDLRRRQALRWPGTSPPPPAAPTASPVCAWNETRKRLRPWYLPCSSSRVPGRYLRSSHGWLKNVAFMVPVASATTASTSGFIPRGAPSGW